ncbi:hypothetical protein EHQ68_12070 [Leptospira congkakensis]|uniref:Uncharacterized protein n=1 Tax=Leptospira congkakensis TaxID=2484932 RepID=A0A4Z1AK88_9LEPT|nr:hypothetical protein [Leptospira congkakensis]TGL87282.1 hypothetical protein EHQ68_12070 [Leptospira congkakensis]TGL96849.1 hypothetical protein EHQ69_01015 [Leptospira congkakensis]TGL97699.1 hypothetical protein EHQ70_06670 [Leptospira congkakensis]
MMKRNFGNLSILFGYLVVSLLVTSVLFGYFEWIRPLRLKSNLISALERFDEDKTKEHLNTLEFFFRESALPYRAAQVTSRIKETLGFSYVRLYDDSLRLIHSTNETNEIFQEELRQDPSGLLEGKLKILSNGDYVYRDLSGKFFVVFPKGPSLPIQIQNANLEYGYLYWAFDPKSQKVLYTNDESILTGDLESNQILRLFSGKEGQTITWKLDGENSKLILEIRDRFSVYLLRQSDTESEEMRFGCFILFLVTFTGLFYIRFVWIVTHNPGFQFKRRILLPVIVYLILLLFYQKSWELFPDYRYYKPWAKHRLVQFEETLSVLEKNLKKEGLGEGESLGETEKIVSELYLWKKGKSDTTTIQNRFGTEIFGLFERIENHPVSILLESEFDLVYLIPKRNEKDTSLSILIAVLDSNLLQAKKEKDRDEFYFPVVSAKLSDNKSKEQITFNPRAWKGNDSIKFLHLEAAKQSVGFLHHKFHTYFISKEQGKPGILSGLSIYRYSSFPPYLLSFGYLFIGPWIFFVLWASIKRRLVEKHPEMLGESLFVSHDSPAIVQEIKKTLSPKEGIETKMEPVINNPNPVKKTSFKILPPATWRRVAILDAVQKKRETIFNPELEKLVHSVTKKSEPQEEAPATENFFTIIPEEKRVEYSLLDKIYRENEISYDGIVGYTKNFISRLGSPRFSYLFLNDALGSFHNQISSGLDYNTRSNLIFLHHDPYLPFDETGFALLDVDDTVRLDRFIAKKFSWEILLQTEAIIAFHMESLGFPGIFLVLLNKEERSKFLDSHKRMIQEKLRQVIPALHVLVEKEERKPEFLKDSLSWMIRSFMQATFGGKRATSVLRIQWPDYQPTPEWEGSKRHFVDSIQGYLESKDRLIETSPNSMLIVTAKDLYLSVIQRLQELPFRHEIKSMKFPDDGQNFYLYF